MPLVILLFAISLGSAQDATGYLLSQINSLRREQGLPAYARHSALTAAARQHARWMVSTGSIRHDQHDGSGPRDRAQNAGYPSNWVSENIYMGGDSSPQSAWNFWRWQSPVHYAGLVSPYYNNIGIGTASGGGRHAFVLVFGNSQGSRPAAGANRQNNTNEAAAPPSYVLGIDASGNIMHEIQPGHTLGDIALIYGYTWDDIPYMLEINNMREDDVRQLEIGSLFLVPPQDGTFTPTASPDTPDAPATKPDPTSAVTATAPAPSPTRSLNVLPIPTQTLMPAPAFGTAADGEASVAQVILSAAAIIQGGIIAAASWRLLRRRF